MRQLQILMHNEQRVLTTQQLAEVYETDVNNIKVNFKNHKTRFIDGKHYYLLKGEELKSFKNVVNDINLVGKNASQLILWTEKGADRHCKILDTDKAWEQFDNLEETYFKVKDASADLALPTTPMQIMEVMFHALKDTNADVKELDSRLEDVESTQTLTWRDFMMKKVAEHCVEIGICFSPFLGKLYKELEKRSGRDLNRTIIQRRKRLKAQGASYKAIKLFAKIDVIEQDKPLRKLFEQIFEEMILE